MQSDDQPSVAVFASSAADVAGHYRELADELGTRIGARNWTLLYGGTLTGMMRSVADSCRAVGGRVEAVTMQRFVDVGIHDHDADELVVTQTLAERKHEFLTRADAFVALPGGFGTLDEVVEVLAHRRVGEFDKPVVVLDHAGYWAPLLGQFEIMHREGMLARGDAPAPAHLGYDVADSPAAVETFLVRHFAGE